MLSKALDNLKSFAANTDGAWIAALVAVLALLLLFRRSDRWLFGAAGALVFVGLVGGWFGRLETVEPLLQHALFGAFATAAVTSAVLTISRRNPVHAALFFAVTVLSVVGVYVLQAAAFLAAATVIVYAGAVIVTFLFVIMLAQQSGLTTYDQRFWQPAPAAVAGGLLFCGLAIAINQHCGRLASSDAVLVRIEQLEAELLAGDVELVAVKPPTVLGLGYDEILRRELELLPETAAVLRMKDILAQASASWKEAWSPRRRVEPERSSTIASVVTRSAEPSIQASRDPGDIRSAAKRLEAIAHLIAAERKSAPTVAAPRRDDRRRIASERSRLSEVGLADRSLVRVLGRSLWGDYLLAVELAGTLLVVGAVGAVAINTRRQETAT